LLSQRCNTQQQSDDTDRRRTLHNPVLIVKYPLALSCSMLNVAEKVARKSRKHRNKVGYHPRRLQPLQSDALSVNCILSKRESLLQGGAILKFEFVISRKIKFFRSLIRRYIVEDTAFRWVNGSDSKPFSQGRQHQALDVEISVTCEGEIRSVKVCPVLKASTSGYKRSCHPKTPMLRRRRHHIRV